MKKCCRNCKFQAELKIKKRIVETIGGNGCVSGWKVGKSQYGIFDETYCCIMIPNTENEGFVIEVEPDDICEMFQRKGDKKNGSKICNG